VKPTLHDGNAVPELPLEPSHYRSSTYLSPKRLASMGWQLQLMERWFPSQTVLEIGPGPGIMRHLLRLEGHQVTTVDPDARLHPDVVGALPCLPLPAKSFDCILCCQVLEHLSWPTARQAIHELQRVSRHGAIISVPTVRPAVGLLRYDEHHDGVRILSLPVICRRSQRNNREHRWELEAGVRTRDFCNELLDAGFSILESIRPALCLYHHFFVVKASGPSQAAGSRTPRKA
jgi:SAM-dependent methyltransferase